jgi:hypothetical protein
LFKNRSYYYSENHRNSCNYITNNRFIHFAPPCGKDFCVATELYHTEGLFIPGEQL